MRASIGVFQPTADLLSTSLFSCQNVTPVDSAVRSYARAKAVGLAHKLTIRDVSELSYKFWDMHRDHILSSDGAAATLLTIQYNLVVGTLCQYMSGREDIRRLAQDILDWKIHAQFCLTELGHGLDIANLETTVELLPNGQLLLNTPSTNAAKFMPPTIPAGEACIAIVFAKLIVGKEDRGIHPFLVPLNDGKCMLPGVTARMLPYRNGSRPVNHALTSFHNVVLPRSALLGSTDHLDRNIFMMSISRVAVGSIALATLAASFFRVVATIAARYSQRRTVIGNGSTPAPIMQFRTQQIPIFTALAQAHVLRAFDRWAVDAFSDLDEDPRVRHGIAACFKVTTVQISQAATISVSDRCGAQGLFEHNQMSVLHAEMRGIAIAEGDNLALSIRLATEILLGRYALPPPADPQCLLARHEASLISEARSILSTLSSHRSPDFNRLILPMCMPLVEAIGHRMAYDASVAAQVPQCLIDLFVASVIKMDAAWYSEVGGITRRNQAFLVDKAVTAMSADLEYHIQSLDAEPYVTAPISSSHKWEDFVAGLPTYDAAAAAAAPLPPLVMARL